MRILIACEFSGTVRDAFLKRGHDAWSCDIYPSRNGGPHLQKDVLGVLAQDWDLMIAHPPCTHLCTSGAKHFHKMEKKMAQLEALNFFRTLLEAPIPRIAVENPIGIVSTRIRPPDQIVQPYEFGDHERKTTCLWLVNLPKLMPTQVVEPKDHIARSGTKIPRWMHTKMSYRSPKLRQLKSITFPGMAAAMAEQWGSLDTKC